LYRELLQQLLSSHLTDLLEESKLSFLQRQKIQNSVHNGDSLPRLSSGRSITSRAEALTSITIKKPFYHKKRTKDTIIRLGAYERDPFVPINPRGTTFTHVIYNIYKTLNYILCKSCAVHSHNTKITSYEGT
jgi:hypothetical protein